jgi:hypothetical protein
MLLALDAPDIQKYGVFAALLAVASMVVFAVAGLARLWRGPLKGWEYPEQPALANRLVTLLSAFLMIFGFFYATPDTEWMVLLIGGILAAVALVVGVNYAGTIMRFRRYKEVLDGNVIKQVPVLAGDELRPEALARIAKDNITDQQYLRGAGPWDANLVWTLESRIRVYKRLMWLFIIALFCGTGALAWLAYAVEVKVTGKAASAILNPAQIPTGETKKPP